MKYIAGVALTSALVTISGAAQATTTTPIPPIDQIGAQFVTETGATSVACSQIPELIICYGLINGAVTASTWAGGVFTPYVDPNAAAATSAPGATPTGVTQDHPDYPVAALAVLDYQPDFEQLCPMWASDPQSVLDEFRDSVDLGSELDYITLSMQMDLTATYEEMEDLMVLAYGNRLDRECV